MVATGSFQYYRNRTSTIGIPAGNSSITEYDVVNTVNYADCCGTYGDMESTITDAGGGAMFGKFLDDGREVQFRRDKLVSEIRSRIDRIANNPAQCKVATLYGGLPGWSFAW
jgi:hypothetical protein